MPLSLDEAQSLVVEALRAQCDCALDIVLEGAPAVGPLAVHVVDETLVLASPPEPDGWILSEIEPGRAWRLTGEPRY